MIRNDDMHNCHSKSRNNCFDKWIAYVISYVRKRFDAIETKLGTESEIPYQVNFSVSDYFEKVERIACEQDNAFIPVELWWGCDGWRQNPDGTFEWVTRWKQEAIFKNPYRTKHTIQIENSNISKLDQQIACLKFQSANIQQSQAIVNPMCNYSVPMPEYIKISSMDKYMPDITRCCCGFLD